MGEVHGAGVRTLRDMILVVRLDAVVDAEALREQVEVAFAALAERPGWVRGRLGRAVDDQDCWVLTAEFADVGSGRRALTSGAVRAAIMPLTSRFPDQPCTFEIVTTTG